MPLFLSYPLLFFGSFLCFYFVASARLSPMLATYPCCFCVDAFCDFNHICRYKISFCILVGWDIAGGAETRYGLHGPGIEARWGRANRPWGPASLLYNRVLGLSRAVKGSVRGLDHPSPSSPEVKERVELCLPFWAFMFCCRVNLPFTFNFTLLSYSLWFCIKYCSEEFFPSLPGCQSLAYCTICVRLCSCSRPYWDLWFCRLTLWAISTCCGHELLYIFFLIYN